MPDRKKTRAQLLAELTELRRRVAAWETAGRRAPEPVTSLPDSFVSPADPQEPGRLQAILRATIECFPFAFFALGPDGRYMLQNAASRQHYGDAIGKRPADLAPDEATKRVWQENNRRAFAGERVEEEVEVQIHGQPFHFYNIITPIRDGHAILGILGVNVDVTQRKQAEEALRVSQERAQLLLDTVRVGIYECDTDGLILWVNSAAEEITGYARSQLIGSHVWDRMPPGPARDAMVASLKRLALEQPAPSPLVVNVVTRQGDTRDIQVDWAYRRDAAGRATGFVCAVADITARRQAEEALQKAHDELEERVNQRTAELQRTNRELEREVEERLRAAEALRYSERRFRNYFEQGLIGMAMTSVDKRWLEVNDRLCEILGYTREELLGTDWVTITHPDDIEPNLRLFQPLLAGEIGHFTLDKRYLKKDGSIVYATIQTRTFRQEDGTIDHIVTLIEDVTARHQAQEAAERERQSLWRMLQASDHERRIISYEIHDGLTQYLAAATMQFQGHEALQASSPDKARKAYETAVELVRQAHAEARRLISEVRPPVIDDEGLETAISHLLHEHRQHGGPMIEFRSSVRFRRLPAILENSLYRIAQEALNNASQHSASDNVRVVLSQEAQNVRLQVQDWGIGFDPQSVEKGHFGLEGIRQRARLLGGQVTIRSAPGRGTLVEVIVPILEEQDQT